MLAGLRPSQALRTPLFWTIVAGLMLYYFVVFGWLSQALPYYRSIGFSDTWAAQLVSLTAGGAVVWLLTAGTQLERFRRPERIAAICVGLVALSMLALRLSGGSTAGIAFHVPLYVLGYSLAPPLEALMFSRGFGLANFATIMGTAFLFQTTAIFFSPIVAGNIYDSTGTYDDAVTLYMICAAVGMVVFLVASRLPQPLRRQLPQSESVLGG